MYVYKNRWLTYVQHVLHVDEQGALGEGSGKRWKIKDRMWMRESKREIERGWVRERERERKKKRERDSDRDGDGLRDGWLKASTRDNRFNGVRRTVYLEMQFYGFGRHQSLADEWTQRTLVQFSLVIQRAYHNRNTRFSLNNRVHPQWSSNVCSSRTANIAYCKTTKKCFEETNYKLTN